MIKVIDSYQYMKIPEVIAQDSRLSSTTKLVFGRVLSLTYNDGKCWATNKFIADSLNVRIRTVQTSITTLYDLGYIKINPEDNNRNRRKRFIYINYDKL